MEIDQHTFKLVIVGDGAVGKSVLLLRYCSVKPLDKIASGCNLDSPSLSDIFAQHDQHDQHDPFAKKTFQASERNFRRAKSQHIIPTRMKMPKRKNNRINQPR